VGKLLGAPIFAVYLAATLMPWALLSIFLGHGISETQFFRGYEALAVGTFMSWSIGLVVSAYSAESVSGNYSSSTGVLAGLVASQAFIPILGLMSEGQETLPYFGVQTSASILWAFTTASLGAWALAGAKWRIGKDLLDGPRWWRLPAFLTFITCYGLGWWSPRSGFQRHLMLLAPALFIYMAAILNSETLDHWKRWLGKGEAGGWHRVPVWVNGLETFGVLSAAVMLLSAVGRVPAERTWFLYPVLQGLFMARDLAFLQWCRLRGLRRPEVVALACIALAYVVPAILIGKWEIWSLRFLYVPVPNAEYGAFANVLPGLLQAAGISWVLARRLRPILK
jgi:hypothetical protein